MIWPNEKPFPIADQVKSLPAYIFHTLKAWTSDYTKKGQKIDALSIGSPDQPCPEFIIQALCEAARTHTHDGYGAFDGNAPFKEAVAQWIKYRFKVTVNPDTEVLLLLGSKEGLGNFCRAIANVGDGILIPDPGYPAYATSLLVAGVRPEYYRLTETQSFVPDAREIEKTKTARTRAIYINYPGNPTGKTLSGSDFQKLIEKCLSLGLAVASDNPYSELYRGQVAPTSALQWVDFRKEPVIEFFSMSKMLNMCGWRIGFAVGNEKLIGALRTVKTHMDTGQFGAIQTAAAAGLTQHREREDFLVSLRREYEERMDAIEHALKANGFLYYPPEATFYTWVRTPAGMNDLDWTKRALDRAHVLVTPGTAFGPSGSGWFRITATHTPQRLTELIGRLGSAAKGT